MAGTVVTGRKRGARITAAALSLALLLPACETPGGAYGAPAAPLTPQQQAMREQSQRWNRTVATGALVGTAAGAGLGAAFARNSGTGALIGAGVGLLAGALAGAMVADRNLAFENREGSASQRIASAQQIAANLNSAAAASEQVTADNRRRLADLDRQYRAGQITAAQYQSQTATMRQDVEVMRKTAAEARDARQRLVASAREVPQLMNEESKIDGAQRRLEVSANDLEEALRRVPGA
jgi:outer membrane lipoprotein SlyB